MFSKIYNIKSIKNQRTICQLNFSFQNSSQLKELTVVINRDDLTYCFKGNTARKRFDDFRNGIELLENYNLHFIKLEEAKKLQNVFKSNLSKISKE